MVLRTLLSNASISVYLQPKLSNVTCKQIKDSTKLEIEVVCRSVSGVVHCNEESWWYVDSLTSVFFFFFNFTLFNEKKLLSVLGFHFHPFLSNVSIPFCLATQQRELKLGILQQRFFYLENTFQQIGLGHCVGWAYLFLRSPWDILAQRTIIYCDI